MIFKQNIKAIFILIGVFLFVDISSMVAQNIPTLHRGENKLAEKTLVYGKRTEVKITPIIQYVIDVDQNHKESLKISFTANWYHKNKYVAPSEKSIFLILNPDKFVNKCKDDKQWECKGKNIENADGLIERSLVLTPNNVLNYTEEECVIQFNSSSKSISAELLFYDNQVITMELLFYFGTASTSEKNVTSKDRIDPWQFKLPPERPICKAKLEYYQNEFNQLEPRHSIFLLENKIDIGKNLHLWRDSVEEYKVNIYQLRELKNSINEFMSENDCDKQFSKLLSEITSCLETRDRIDKIATELDLEIDSIDIVGKKFRSGIKQLTDNVETAQRFYRDLKHLQWKYKEGHEIDNQVIEDKMSTFHEFAENQDTIYSRIVESGKSNFKIDQENRDFKSYYNASVEIVSNMYPENEEVVESSSEIAKVEKEKKKDPSRKGIPFFFYLIPILSFVLGVVAFKYMGKVIKAVKIKKKVKP